MLELSCPDWQERLFAGRSLVPDLQLPNENLARRAVAAFNKLRLADVPGTPALEEAGGDWFRDIVRAMFGTLDPATRARLIRELFVLVPKKNAKTTYGALGLMLVGLLLNERPRARFAFTAPVQDTAEEAFSAASGAIALDPVLDKLFHVREHLKTIVHRQTKAELEIMTFDPAILTGMKFSGGVLIDELHVVAKSAKASKTIRQIRGGMLPFPEAFLAIITTMPDEAPVGVMKTELTKARRVRDGQLVADMLPVLYELPREIQQDKTKPPKWLDRALWQLVNPNMGRSVTMEGLERLYQDAQEKGEAELRGWASQHLNLEIGLALMSDSWPGAEFWERQARPQSLTLEELVARCNVATIGIDGGGLDDLLGLCVLGRDSETGEWLAWCKAWAHKVVLERRKEIAPQLLDFAAAGDLTIVETVGDDAAELADIVEQVHLAGLLDRDEDVPPELRAAIGADPARITAVVDELFARGIPREAVIGISQGWRLMGAITVTERRLAAGRLWHAGAPLMTWCVGNAKIEQRANSILVTRQASGTAKIDPLMALFDAAELMARVPEDSGKSFWETGAAVPA